MSNMSHKSQVNQLVQEYGLYILNYGDWDVYINSKFYYIHVIYNEIQWVGSR